METTSSRKRERWQTGLLVAMLLGVGGLAWSFQLQQPLEVEAGRLATLPRRIDAWTAVDIPLEDTVESMLRADYNLQRIYHHPIGSRVAVYIGYYGTARGGRPEHTPWICYPSAGWSIEDQRTLVVDAERGLEVNELEVALGRERRLVHFWYRSFRATGLLGAADQLRDRLIGRIRHGRSDGALIRLSAPLVDHDLDAARAQLVRFGRQLDPLLEHHWPEERSPERG